jgi:hypothetical protein
MEKCIAGVKLRFQKKQAYSYKKDPAIVIHDGYYNPVSKEMSTSFEIDNLSKALSCAETYFKGYKKDLPLPITEGVARDLFAGYPLDHEEKEYISSCVKSGGCKGDDNLLLNKENVLLWVITLFYKWGKDERFPVESEYRSGSRDKRGD